MAEQVWVAMNEEQLRHKADELAAQPVALDELAEERKEANKAFGDRKEDLSAKIRKLTAIIRHKGEYQDAQAPLLSLPPHEVGRRGSRRSDS
jgi:hypothetical protein